ncbi:hypothetical protein DP44_3355 [Burkholderia pseudomallei]|nr:hypothetical protein DP44_3355 [Burkholderia pseudomallei]
MYNASNLARYTLHYTHEHWIFPGFRIARWTINPLKTCAYICSVEVDGSQWTSIVVIVHQGVKAFRCRVEFVLFRLNAFQRFLKNADFLLLFAGQVDGMVNAFDHNFSASSRFARRASTSIARLRDHLAGSRERSIIDLLYLNFVR